MPALQVGQVAALNRGALSKLFLGPALWPRRASMHSARSRRTSVSDTGNPHKLEGLQIRERLETWAKPSKDNLEYHAYNVFR